MKRNLCLFLLSPFLLAGVACGGHGSKKPVDVVIISGQSNAVGCTWSWHLSETMGIEKKTDYEEGFDEKNIIMKDTLFEVTNLFKTLLQSGDVVLLENDLPDNYK